MSREVRLLPGARRDLGRLKDFLATKNPRAARAARHAIEAAVRSLAVFPHRGRLSDVPDLRELVVRYGRDGYVVRYRVEPKLAWSSGDSSMSLATSHWKSADGLNRRLRGGA